MHHSTSCTPSLFERCVACLMLLLVLPVFVLAALIIRRRAGAPVVITVELSGADDWPVRRGLRFRTTGREASRLYAIGRFLHAGSIVELPGLWSVARGDIRLSDLGLLRLK